MRYGSLWRRAAALVIDVGLYVLLYGMAIFGLDGLLDLQLRGLEFRGSIFAFREFEMRGALIMLVIKLVVGLVYFAGFEAAAVRATPGKLLLGLQVTDMTGRRLSLGRAAFRFLAKALSGVTAGLGYLLAGFTKHHQALHDLIAGTVVLSRQS
jgi:uncharacterized RDD family membrane protein YckC